MASFLDFCVFELIAGMHSKLGTRWMQKDRMDPFARLYLVKSGEADLWLAGRHIPLRPWHLYLLPSDTRISFSCGNRIDIDWVHFNATHRNGADLFALLKCKNEAAVSDRKSMAGLFSRMIGLLDKDSVQAELEKRACLFQILAFMLEDSPNPKLASHESLLRFAPAIDRIEKDVSGRIRIASLASSMKMKPSSFSRLFSRHFKMSPKQYLQRKKILKARRLLTETDRKVEDIGAELGFSDAFHFSRMFKRITGKPPKTFRSSREEMMP